MRVLNEGVRIKIRFAFAELLYAGGASVHTRAAPRFGLVEGTSPGDTAEVTVKRRLLGLGMDGEG